MRVLLIFLLFQSLAFGQNSRLSTRGSTAQSLQSSSLQHDYEKAKKITRLKPEHVPVVAPTEYDDFRSADEGWVGEVPYFSFKVFSVINENEMLLKLSDNIIWLSDYPTQEFTDELDCRIIGPIRAGKTKSYEGILGTKNTVRTFTLLKGKELQEFLDKKEKGIGDRKFYKEIEVLVNELLWGSATPKPPSSVNSSQRRKYENLCSKILKGFEKAQIDKNQVSNFIYDKRKKKLTFKSEEVRVKAIDVLKQVTGML